MARSKSKTDQVKIAAQRLIEDDEIQKQLRIAGVRMRQAWGRASGRPASKAAQDKKLYKQVREAAASLIVVGRGLGKKPEPPKRTGRKLVAGAAIVGGTAYAVQKKRSSNGNGTPTAATDQPVAAPTPPLAAVD